MIFFPLLHQEEQLCRSILLHKTFWNKHLDNTELQEADQEALEGRRHV
jgi:hypothetical protein